MRGSGDRRNSGSSAVEIRQRAQAGKQPGRGKPVPAVERKAERVRERRRRERRSRPGTLTLEWNPRKRQPLQASERPFRATGPGQRETKKAAACPEALIRSAEKPLAGERRGETSGALCPRSSVPCMPAVSQAGIRSLGTIFFGGTTITAPPGSACVPPHTASRNPRTPSLAPAALGRFARLFFLQPGPPVAGCGLSR